MIAKELRALAPMWAGVAATITAAAILRDPRMTGAGLFAFAVGSIALGAHSIGHEYTHRTLPVLLALPYERRRLLFAKLSALAPMVLGLAALAWLMIFRDAELVRAARWRDYPAPFILVLCALFVAPWLTMVCRSTMGGVAFTAIIPPMLVIGGDVAGGLKYGYEAAAPVDALKFKVLWWGMLAIAPFAAVAGWRTFMRLEALEGAGREFHLPRWRLGRAGARRTHPVLALVAKELRLQQLSFVLFGMIAAMWLVLALTQRTVARPSGVFDMLLTLSLALLAVVVGSLACAEERQLGTHDAQLLLPLRAWTQWMVKAGVALGLAIALGVTIPMLAAGFVAHPPVAPAAAWRSLGMAVLVLTSISLYVSSVSASGVRAAVMSLPVLIGLVVFVQIVMSTLSWIIWTSPVVERAISAVVHGGLLPVSPAEVRHVLVRALGFTPVVLGGLVATLLLYFGFLNYRAGERSARRIALQLLCVAGVVILVLTVESLASRAFSFSFR